MNHKKWLTLSVVATALLLIPRRSSRQTTSDAHANHLSKKDKGRQPERDQPNDKKAAD